MAARQRRGADARAGRRGRRRGPLRTRDPARLLEDAGDGGGRGRDRWGLDGEFVCENYLYGIETN